MKYEYLFYLEGTVHQKRKCSLRLKQFRSVRSKVVEKSAVDKLSEIPEKENANSSNSEAHIDSRKDDKISNVCHLFNRGNYISDK